MHYPALKVHQNESAYIASRACWARVKFKILPFAEEIFSHPYTRAGTPTIHPPQSYRGARRVPRIMMQEYDTRFSEETPLQEFALYASPEANRCKPGTYKKPDSMDLGATRLSQSKLVQRREMAWRVTFVLHALVNFTSGLGRRFYRSLRPGMEQSSTSEGFWPAGWRKFSLSATICSLFTKNLHGDKK